MQRVLSTAALIGLLIATAAAFAITERLKLVRSPVWDTFVSKRLSPTCGCARGKALIRVRLRHGDDVTLTIRSAGGATVRTLAAGEFTPRGEASYVWDGRTDEGAVAPDGVYRPEIHLARQRRTILLPNRIGLDTHAPRVVGVKLSRPVISPDGDGIGDTIRIHYRLDSAAHVLVYLDGNLVIRSRSYAASATVNWHGRDLAGQPLLAGLHVLYLGAVDLAGNVTPSYERQPVLVTIRYIALSQQRIVARPGKLFTVGVDTDAKHWWWKFAGRSGAGKDMSLSLRAPAKPGQYRLSVGERTYGARATVVVTNAR